MPNTLAHFAVQGPLTRLALRQADARWVLVGCVIPDIPWILRRAIGFSGFPVDPYSLRLYAIVQASLLFCLILSVLLATLAINRPRAFWVLALGSVTHLVLDALQTRWGNGVHLFAPFSWDLQSFDLFWPESPIAIAMTLGGVAYFVWAWIRFAGKPIPVSVSPPRRLLLAVGLAAVYVAGPLAFLEGPLRSDSHSIQTLLERELRPGRVVELDRVRYLEQGGVDMVQTFAGEKIAARGVNLARSGRFSVRGRFVDANTLTVIDLHRHWGRVRDIPSYLGLALVAALWFAAPLRTLFGRRNNDSSERWG